MAKVNRVLPRFKKWITLEQLDNNYMTQEIQECYFDEYHEDVLIQEIVKNKYIICGDSHQYLAIPVFSDGYLLLTMRRWAELMDRAAMEIDGYSYVKGNYNEHSFYMASSFNGKENLPKCE